MRVEQRQVKDQPLTVIVEYPEYDKSVDNLINKIKNMSISFTGKSDGKTVSIDISDIYYIENVERKIFLYSKKDIYRYDGSMADIDSSISETDLVRISRTCFMNVSHLKEIMQIKNSHLEAVLDNGEKLIVSRKYLKDIKKIFRRKLL
ncbi:MAG: LytTR family DNA-binding domain-containing protein [Eubacteriales bacterium]|jgi:DNA-binding LytR/AlgR family response regulator|nr:LytTR family transcriptional regulator [Clostridiales bacterium]MBQ1574344.1 LytTR family transcriptional regulator [Clostridiales bacterium]MBR2597720.1 LytTR family transcriptional regulator [Clostridiales bacterium]MDO4420904.1 LytTR family DNA-binding domain-containing protein [Eubacteriales bacterium]